MEPQPGLEVGKLEIAQFNASLPILFEFLLKCGNTPSTSSCVVNAKISHHRLNWWVIWL